MIIIICMMIIAVDGAVGSSFVLSMEVVIGDFVGFVFNNIYISIVL